MHPHEIWPYAAFAQSLCLFLLASILSISILYSYQYSTQGRYKVHPQLPPLSWLIYLGHSIILNKQLMFAPYNSYLDFAPPYYTDLDTGHTVNHLLLLFFLLQTFCKHTRLKRNDNMFVLYLLYMSWLAIYRVRRGQPILILDLKLSAFLPALLPTKKWGLKACIRCTTLLQVA